MPSIFSLSIPQLSQWSRRQKVDHRQQNEPVEAINRMMTGIGVPRQRIDARMLLQRSVVLVKEPDLTEDASIAVRAIEYADRPPVVGQYRFSTAAFEAYPALGISMADFAGLAWLQPPPEEPPPEEPLPVKQPDLSAAICEACVRGSLWYVQPPIYPDRFVVAQSYTDDDSDGNGRMLIVQEVLPSLGENGRWTGVLFVTGESVEMNVWPTMKAADFAPFLWVPEVLNDQTTILPLTFWHGTWWLKQRPKRAVALRRGPLRIVDCQPTEAIP